MEATQNKNAVISAQILALRIKGISIKDAMNAVCGAGYYERMVEELYSELRAKAAL